MNKEVTRRDFVKGAAAGAVVVASSSILASCTSGSAVETGLPEKWDKETDVIVIGYGVAGACAAMKAHDDGAEVLLLEKEALPGGSTALSGGMFCLGGGTALQKDLGINETPDEFYNFLMAQGQNEAQEELQRLHADHAVETFDWLENTLGLEFPRKIAPWETGSSNASGCGLGFLGNEWYPPIMKKVGRAVSHAHYQATAGKGFFEALKKQVDARGITVMLDTPTKKMIFDYANKRVLGVKAEENGQEINIKARKAVILTTGGYGRNKEVVKGLPQNYLDYVTFRPKGNTGDGLAMAQEVGGALFACDGADFLGHFGPSPSEWGPSGDLDLDKYTFIYVDRSGKRFTSEEFHLGIKALYWGRTGNIPGPSGESNLSTRSLMQKDVGGWVIFDETTRKYLDLDTTIVRGPDFKEVLIVPEVGLEVPCKTVSGNSIEELCNAVKSEIDPLKGEGIDSIGLKETLDSWNSHLPEDPEWDRKYGLIPIDKPPYYATFLWPFMLNETTGIKIDATAHVVNAWNEPISRLYSAGRNTGGQYGRIYTCGTALASGVIIGNIAGENAAKEEPWE